MSSALRAANSRSGLAMFNHLLIATDGTELATKAVTIGLELAKTLGAKVTVVTISEPWNVLVANRARAMGKASIDAYENAVADAASEILASVDELAARLE